MACVVEAMGVEGDDRSNKTKSRHCSDFNASMISNDLNVERYLPINGATTSRPPVCVEDVSLQIIIASGGG